MSNQNSNQNFLNVEHSARAGYLPPGIAHKKNPLKFTQLKLSRQQFNLI